MNRNARNTEMLNEKKKCGTFDVRGVFDELIGENAALLNSSLDVTTVLLLAIKLQRLASAILAWVEHIIAELAKSHHFRRLEILSVTIAPLFPDHRRRNYC